MLVKIRPWGNSFGIRLPAAVLKRMKIADGDMFELESTSSAITLTHVKKSYSLKELVAKCDPFAPEPEGLEAWNKL